MNDCISRRAAIDELDKWESKYTWDFWCNEHKDEPEKYHITAPSALIASLPSAQPEIIRCKECKNWDTTWQNDWAKNYHYCPLIDGTRNGDFYCADAERRTDETN